MSINIPGAEPGMGHAVLIVLGLLLALALWRLWGEFLDGFLGGDTYEDRNPSYK